MTLDETKLCERFGLDFKLFLEVSWDGFLEKISYNFRTECEASMFNKIGVLTEKTSLIAKRRARIATIIIFVIVSFQIQLWQTKIYLVTHLPIILT